MQAEIQFGTLGTEYFHLQFWWFGSNIHHKMYVCMGAAVDAVCLPPYKNSNFFQNFEINKIPNINKYYEFIFN